VTETDDYFPVWWEPDLYFSPKFFSFIIIEFSPTPIYETLSMLVFWVVTSCGLVVVHSYWPVPCLYSFLIHWLWLANPHGLALLLIPYKTCTSLTSGLRMEAVCSSETLESIYKSTWRNNPEDQHRHLHRHEDLGSSEDNAYNIVFMQIRS
jgi:hypothetical protein